jgi:hypothetical protein
MQAVTMGRIGKRRSNDCLLFFVGWHSLVIFTAVDRVFICFSTESLEGWGSLCTLVITKTFTKHS